MAAGASAILFTFSLSQLQDLARRFAIPTGGCKSRADYVGRLAAEGGILAALQEPAFQVRPLLKTRSVAELKALAAEHGVDTTGLVKKWDLVNRIADSPSAPHVLSSIQGLAATPEIPEPPPPDLSGAEELLIRGKNMDADFGLAEDILDQARMRFEERAFDRVLELSHEALVLLHGTQDAFERSAWAYAILASKKLIEESGRAGRDVVPATSLLRDATVAYISGNLAANRDLLIRLQSATKSLYSEEVQRLQRAIYAAEDRIQQAGHLGADVAVAQESLNEARGAMQRAEHTKALDLLAKTERLAKDAFDARVEEIANSIPATSRLIEESQQVGAEAGDALRLLEKARVAVERQEYVLAAELVERAERSALKAQHYQIQRVMELRLRQIERAQSILNRLVPILDEAAGYGIDVEPIRRELADAEDVLDQGDYVNGTILAKRVEERSMALVPRVVAERPKHGIEKPSSGRCTVCESPDVAFMDDGWSRCNACSVTWRWRVPSGQWAKFRALVRE